jgi:peptide/nickel transport system substrate-binding protein
VAYVADVAAPDDVTVVITLAMMSPTFYIDINRVWFLNEARAGELEYGFTNELPGGTGPYTLSTWRPDSKVIVTRNPNYHGAPAPIGTIDITVFGDTNAAMRAFEAGELDYTSNGVPPADWERIVSSGKYKTYVQDTITVVFVSINNQVAPFNDVRVRQAFNYAINKDDMIYAAVEGFGTPASVLGNSNLLFGIPKPGEIFEYEYNPERARQLLAEAGYPNGLVLGDPILTMATDEFSIPAQVVQDQLSRVGVNLDIRILEQSALVEDLILGNYTIGMMALSLSVDASMITLAYKTDYIDALNLARYSNQRVDDLFEQAGSTMDQQARIRLYREAFDIASREAAYIPLYSMQAGFAMDPDLEASVYTNFYDWYWK